MKKECFDFRSTSGAYYAYHACSARKDVTEKFLEDVEATPTTSRFFERP